MTSIAILGSTGSIGKSSLEVISAFPDRFRVSVLTANRNIDLLREQILAFHPSLVCVADERSARLLESSLDHENGTTRIISGEAGLVEAATYDGVDLVISALVGFAGLSPTYHAIRAGKDIALANKETLVVGGSLIMDAVRRHGVRLLPIDSEHSAILQCLQGEEMSRVRRLILTASGGPFRTLPREQFDSITPDQALAHPTWRMGKKITIDSATLMNKGLEVIEAHWLFGLPAEQIHVVVHPQSIIHSMVEFIDGSIKAQLGSPDMKTPIQYALTHPDRGAREGESLNFAQLGQLTFFEPDFERFPCLALAFDALRAKGNAPAVLNAANEVAVSLFLEDRIGFNDIPSIIAESLDAHAGVNVSTLDELIALDRETRAGVLERVASVE
jgi:1-deoxy-D-xylulose-5-phosphate reductoisomerase